MAWNLNLSATLNATKLFFKPGICLPHCTVPTFNDLPIPLDKGLHQLGRQSDIRAVVLDKDDCFAYPDAKHVHEPYKVSSGLDAVPSCPSCTPCPPAPDLCRRPGQTQLTIPVAFCQSHFQDLRRAYPGRRLLVVSNTAGAAGWDPDRKQAAEVEKNTGVHVLPHSAKKPGCGAEIMAYFRQHPETGVTDPSHVAVVGDRLTTDMMLANMMGGWGFWISEGVVPRQQKSVVGLPPPVRLMEPALAHASCFAVFEDGAQLGPVPRVTGGPAAFAAMTRCACRLPLESQSGAKTTCWRPVLSV